MNDFIGNNVYIELAFWLFCAFVTVLIASLRKKNVTLWALIGVVFGVFAIIVILVLPRDRKKNFGAKHRTREESRAWYLKTKEEFEEYKKKEVKTT